MSMTKRWIDDLREQATGGDEFAQQSLSEAGLWESEEAQRQREEQYFYSMMEFETDERMTDVEIDELENEESFASTSWCVEDVLQAARDNQIDITPKQAEKFLQEHAEKITDAMVEAGWSVIENGLNELPK